MERLSLFENRDALEANFKGETSVILTKEDACKHFLLNWSDCASKQLKITIEKAVSLDILEIGDRAERNIEVTLGENAHVEWRSVNLVQGKDARFHFALNASASLDFAFADFSKGTETIDVAVDLSGDEASLTCHNAALSYESDTKNISISVRHHAPNTYALVSSYGVAQGTGILKFSGTSHILNGAPKSKTHQNAKIMVFDPHSVGRANPILKIDENDVEASHSAAVGKVNDEHLFYLCSRGLTPQDAKRLITMGYLNPIIRYFNEKNIQKAIEKAIMGSI